MPQKGSHTWDLYIEYHRCPKCGYILESRQNFEKRSGNYVKDLTCRRCKHHFSLTKNEKSKFGPLIGDPQPVEFDWDTKK